jgi:phage regulator Rha-like protein
MNTSIVPAQEQMSMSSREIATLTGKQHAHVTRDIRNMLEELEISPSKFGDTYLDSRGKAYPEFNLPKRETIILTSGYSTVQRATIIDRWLELESKAQEGADLSGLDAGTALLVNQVIAVARLKVESEKQNSRLDVIEATIKSGTGYQTVSAWGKMNGAPMALKTAQKLGSACAAKCKKHGISVGKVPDERFGEVNSYPIDVINECSEKLLD